MIFSVAPTPPKVSCSPPTISTWPRYSDRSSSRSLPITVISIGGGSAAGAGAAGGALGGGVALLLGAFGAAVPATSRHPFAPAGMARAPAARARRLTASAASRRPRTAGTLRSATARSAMTMLAPVWRAIATATSAARPAGASTRTLSACAEALATIATSPIHDAGRILLGPDLPTRSGVADTDTKERPDRAGIAANGFNHHAARQTPLRRSRRNGEFNPAQA